MILEKSHYIGAGIPHVLFGRTYTELPRRHLYTILQHYSIGGLHEGRKIDYIHAIHLLARDCGLPNTPELYQTLCHESTLPALHSPVRQVSLRILLGGELTSSRVERRILRGLGLKNVFNVPRIDVDEPIRSVRLLPATASNDCISCMESLAKPKGPRLLITQSCNHDRDICLECLSQHIDVQFRDNIWDQIRCPSQACREIMDAEDVNKYAPKETANRYNERLMQQLFQNEKTFQHCRHSPCENVQEVSVQQGSPFMVCFECERRTCIDCDTKWHPFVTCRENMQVLEEARATEERESATKIAEISKQCPRCACPTEKTGGCDHMTCQRCRYEYCWQCRANYDIILRTDAVGHNSGCIYHPNNGGDNRRFPFGRQIQPLREYPWHHQQHQRADHGEIPHLFAQPAPAIPVPNLNDGGQRR